MWLNLSVYNFLFIRHFAVNKRENIKQFELLQIGKKVQLSQFSLSNSLASLS